MLTLLVGALATGVIGCGGTTNGAPTTGTSTTTQSLFNPCTGIPDDALRAAGVDPATEEKGVAGVDQSGWEICRWKGSRYSMTVFSTGRTIAEFEKKPGNVEFRDVTVAGREGRQFKVEGASKGLLCDVLFRAARGVVQLRVSNLAGLDNLEDPCVTLYRVGESVVPVLPN
ncbi:DUF3558 domain-containing protein [Nocardia sputi]|uniref:DUF3558 domain-containing protein n=1 Tax=Nocardia sputi TaxID=2943705 RepID=UPI0020C02D53|nr:DUF3558 domain-containing protein [Nocardia sputi]